MNSLVWWRWGAKFLFIGVLSRLGINFWNSWEWWALIVLMHAIESFSEPHGYERMW